MRRRPGQWDRCCRLSGGGQLVKRDVIQRPKICRTHQGRRVLARRSCSVRVASGGGRGSRTRPTCGSSREQGGPSCGSGAGPGSERVRQRVETSWRRGGSPKWGRPRRRPVRLCSRAPRAGRGSRPFGSTHLELSDGRARPLPSAVDAVPRFIGALDETRGVPAGLDIVGRASSAWRLKCGAVAARKQGAALRQRTSIKARWGSRVGASDTTGRRPRCRAVSISPPTRSTFLSRGNANSSGSVQNTVNPQEEAHNRYAACTSTTTLPFALAVPSRSYASLACSNAYVESIGTLSLPSAARAARSASHSAFMSRRMHA